jgi:hypothetical protein
MGLSQVHAPDVQRRRRRQNGRFRGQRQRCRGAVLRTYYGSVTAFDLIQLRKSIKHVYLYF